MTQVVVAVRSRSRPLRALRSIINDALYRGSLILLVNTVAASALGFVFWTLAARTYPASTVGVFSSVVSGAGLLAAIAALGLPNTMIRHVASAENPLGLVVAAVLAIATVGSGLCLVAILALGPHLPPALHLQQRGGLPLLVTALVVLTAAGGTFDAGLIATRASHAILIKNVIGSVAKVAALYLLVSFRSSGLLLSYGVGLALATGLGGLSLGRQLWGKGTGLRSIRVPRRYLTITSGNYLATIMGILPLSVVPIEVLLARGAAETARFAVAFLIAGFLNVIPSTVSQVLFAEASRQGVPLGGQLRNALRGVYGLLLPAVAVVVAAAPFALRVFGAAYATAATGCLRILALSALLTGGTYLVDSMLIARDRMKAYIFINGANAALVLGCVWALLPRGLTGAAMGWALAQGVSLILGLILVATGKAGRHHAIPALQAALPGYPEHDPQPSGMIYAFEPQIRNLLATRPTMPTTLIAERIGWGRSAGVLLDRVSELRPAASDYYRRLSQTRYRAGEIAQCGVWFPPIEIPVGFGQTRTARQLPVLTMITGYSRWLSAIMIPSIYAEDLFAGLWELIAEHGAVPRVLTWDSEIIIGGWGAGKEETAADCRRFCRTVDAECIITSAADLRARGLTELANVDLERSFLPSRTFASPADFNGQLAAWVATANTSPGQQLNTSPARLITTDRQAMMPLPPVPPPTGWHISMKIGSQPLVRFDSNSYSVHPAVTGRKVEMMADLRRIRVLHGESVAADHERAWAHQCAVADPAHLKARR